MKVSQVSPDITEREKELVMDTLDRAWLTEGRYAKEFLERILDYTGARYAVLAPNGTLAIYMALRVLGIGDGDRVLVPDITFNATAAAVHFTGATPVFCDVDVQTMQMDMHEAEQYWGDVDAIVPVHLYGQAADMAGLEEYKGIIMEDAAQGLGVHYKGVHVGTIGDAGTVSFFADKDIIMGEGGLILTDDPNTYTMLHYLRNQGRLASGTFTHDAIGMNYRITDMQCALAVAQMERIDDIHARKHAIYDRYVEGLQPYIMDETVHLMKKTRGSTHIPLRMPLLVDDKAHVMHVLEKHDIQVRSLEMPLHQQPCWQQLGYNHDCFPMANYVYEHGIRLPMHSHLTDEQIAYVCDILGEALDV